MSLYTKTGPVVSLNSVEDCGWQREVQREKWMSVTPSRWRPRVFSHRRKTEVDFFFFGAWLFCLTHPVIYQQSWVYAKSLVWKLLLSLRRRVAVKPQSALSARGGTFSLMIFLLQDPFCQCWTVSVTLANEWTPSCDTVFNIHRVGGRRRKWSMCHRARN